MVVKEKGYIAAHRLSIYDSDGGLWYQFSLDYDEPDYFKRKEKQGFKPFSTVGSEAPYIVVLRLSAESPNWYQVEVNEGTRDTKFIAKADPMWGRTKWTTWLNRSFNLHPDLRVNKLRESPGGKVIQEFAELKYTRMMFVKAEGDWALVDGNVHFKGSYKGWIRWRRGREILVGWVLNDDKIPEYDSISDKP